MNTNKTSDIKSRVVQWLVRLVVYCVGIIVVSLGIVCCKKSGLGISPISCIPYVLELATPLSFGTMTMLFHLANTLIQYILERKLWNVKIFLQVPVAVLFGVVIDAWQSILVVDTSKLWLQLLALVCSVFFTALGMILMIHMQLVQNPPDGTVRRVSAMLGVEMGRIKIIYDICCVVISLALSFLLLGKLKGFGIATIVSALFVGKTLTWLGGLGRWLDKRLDL